MVRQMDELKDKFMTSHWLLSCDEDKEEYNRTIEVSGIEDLKTEARWFGLTRPESEPGQTVTVTCHCLDEGDFLCDTEKVPVTIPDNMKQVYIHDIMTLMQSKQYPRGISNIALRFEYALHQMSASMLDDLRMLLVGCSVKD